MTFMNVLISEICEFSSVWWKFKGIFIRQVFCAFPCFSHKSDYEILRCNDAKHFDLIFPSMRLTWYFCVRWRWIKGILLRGFCKLFVIHKGRDKKEIYCSSFQHMLFCVFWAKGDEKAFKMCSNFTTHLFLYLKRIPLSLFSENNNQSNVI